MSYKQILPDFTSSDKYMANSEENKYVDMGLK